MKIALFLISGLVLFLGVSGRLSGTWAALTGAGASTTAQPAATTGKSFVVPF